MEKDKLEKAFREAGTAPVLREKMGDYDLFISDGFSHPPHIRYQRFGVEPGEFPAGAWVTFWWLGRGEKLHLGRPLFFDGPDAFIPGRRINAARADAAKAMKHLKIRKPNALAV